MAELTIQQITEAGGTVTYSAASSGGDTADNGGGTFLHIKNGGSEEAVTVTITAQTTTVDSSIYGDLTKANASIAVAAGAEAFIGPFKQSAFNNANGEIAISYSQVVSVTIAALYMTQSQMNG
tara:strand:- start:2483 stop:2851 length:369 start_codon:yes stop_codon:yes gene_type:complete